jgi:hypothetical protein
MLYKTNIHFKIYNDFDYNIVHVEFIVECIIFLLLLNGILIHVENIKAKS